MRLSKAETSCLGNDITHSQDWNDTARCCWHLRRSVGRWAGLQLSDHGWYSWATCVEKRLCLPFSAYVCLKQTSYQAFISLVSKGSSSWRLEFSLFTLSLWRLFVVLAGIPVHTEFRHLFFLWNEFFVYRDTGVYAAYTTFGSPPDII